MHVTDYLSPLALKHLLLKDIAGLVGCVAVSNEGGSMLRVQAVELSLDQPDIINGIKILELNVVLVTWAAALGRVASARSPRPRVSMGLDASPSSG